MTSAEPKPQKLLEWPNYGLVNVEAPRPRDSSATDATPRPGSEPSPQRSRLLWQALLASIALTTGCATSSPTTFVSAEIPASLRQPCPQLPDLAGNDSISLFLWARDVIALYNECALRHDRTIEALP